MNRIQHQKPLCSVQSLSHVNYLQPQGLQHARPSCPSPIPRVYSNSCPLCWLCHPTISSSVIPFSCLQSSPAAESFPMYKWPKYWSFSFNISPSNEYSGLISFSMDWLDLLAVQGTLKSQSSSTPEFKSINSSALSFLYGPTHLNR